MSDWLIVNGNKIHITARIHPNVQLGEGNVIHAGVVIDGYRGNDPHATIGDNNVIHENVRILCNHFIMESYCKLHNHVFIDGDYVELLSNVWVGQYSHLDGYAPLIIRNDVTIGYNCYIWTHANRDGLVGHRPTASNRTTLERGVWLMGANVQVNPGVTMGEFSRAYGNSVVTEDTWPGSDYGGIPARLIP